MSETRKLFESFKSNLNEGFFNLYKSYDKLYGISKYSPNELKNFINDLKQHNRISDKDYDVLIDFAEKYQNLIDNTGYESNLAESNLDESEKEVNDMTMEEMIEEIAEIYEDSGASIKDVLNNLYKADCLLTGSIRDFLDDLREYVNS